MIHLLRHDMILYALYFLQEPILLLKGTLNQQVMLAKFLTELQHNRSLLLTSLFDQSGELADSVACDLDYVHDGLFKFIHFSI